MNRKIDGFHIRNLLDTIRKRIPDIVLRTSLIVGFPGEGESEYKELVDFVKEGYFQHIGVFAYSREENTPAASFPNQVEEAVKKERRSQLMAIQSKTSRRLLRRRQTQVCKVLVEGIESDGIYYGRSYGEAPEVDGLVYISSDNPLKIGEFTDVRITRAFEYDLLGEAYESRK